MAPSGSHHLIASQEVLVVKSQPANARDIRDSNSGSVPGVGKIPWRRAWQPTPVFLPGKSHGQRKPGGLQPVGLQRVRHDQSNLAHTHQGAGGDRGKGPPQTPKGQEPGTRQAQNNNPQQKVVPGPTHHSCF